jgi:hypothetical protein
MGSDPQNLVDNADSEQKTVEWLPGAKIAIFGVVRAENYPFWARSQHPRLGQNHRIPPKSKRTKMGQSEFFLTYIASEGINRGPIRGRLLKRHSDYRVNSSVRRG